MYVLIIYVMYLSHVDMDYLSVALARRVNCVSEEESSECVKIPRSTHLCVHRMRSVRLSLFPNPDQ